MKNATGDKNLQMNSEVFALRKRAMKFVYEARNLVSNLPRVEIRIVENDGAALGKARIDGVKSISIHVKTFTASEEMLRHVVFHELCHTLFKTKHDEKCKLMMSIVTTAAPKEYIYKTFRSHAANFGG